MEIEDEEKLQRINLYKKIEKLEENGEFDVDANDDPIAPVLEADAVDYLKTRRLNKVKSRIVKAMAEYFFDKMKEEHQIIIKEINGMENLENIETGGIITSNHFNPFECLSVIRTFEDSKLGKNRKIYAVIREGNYTNFTGFFGLVFKNCNTLPLSSSQKTMKKFYQAVKTILNNKDFILIYPEQSLWLNYQKPKPLKEGAYRFAVKNNVPIIPFFITTKESEYLDDLGFPVLEYYIHINKPIYKKEGLTDKENIAFLKSENFKIWKNIYEKFYNKKLTYTCKKDKLPQYIIDELDDEIME